MIRITRLLTLTIVLTVAVTNTLSAQKKDAKTDFYKSQWTKVEHFDNNELPRSADSVASLIHNRAIKEMNTGEAAKAFMAMQGYRREFTENEWSDLQKAMQEELLLAWEPYRQVVHSLSAQLIINYYNSRRWHYYQMQTHGDSTKLETMGAKQLMQLTMGHIDQSLANAQKLQATNISSLPQIIEKGTKPAHLRPTLWEFLMFNAMDQLEAFNGFNTIGFGEPFSVDISMFAAPEAFLKLNFQNQSAPAPLVDIMNKWQQLTRFRQLRPNEKEAAINIYLERVLWLANRYNDDNIDSLLFAKYDEIVKLAQGWPISALATYHKAMAYQSITAAKGETDYIKTIQMLEKAATAWPKSEGGLLCRQQIDAIKAPQISIRTENVYYPNRQGIVDIESKNCTSLYAMFIPLGDNTLDNNKHIDSDSLLVIYKNAVNLKTVQLSVPKFTDYRAHNTGAVVPPLAPGSYMMVVSDKQKLQKKNTAYAFTRIEVTALGAITQSMPNGTKLTVLDRLSGKPLSDVEVTPYYYAYRRYNDKSTKTPQPSQKTDANGEVVIKASEESHRYLSFELKKGKDTYCGNMGYVGYYPTNNQDQPTRSTLYIFTDRKIYRPGQTVQFKAILMESNGSEAKAVTNFTVNLALRDVNGNELQKLQLKTNAFGSCSGVFQIPANVLTGDWAITSMLGSSTFLVEAYKRPKFTVELTAPVNAYKMGDSITVTGKATAYSGSPLMNASVKYSVKQGMRNMPFNWTRQQRDKANSEIALGTITVDTKGSFAITFKSSDPIGNNINYDQLDISVDVTDINGETQSENLVVPIDIKDRLLSVDAPSEVYIDKGKAIKITPYVTNLVGQPLTGKGSYKVYRYVPNAAIKPVAHWRKPEVQLAPDSVVSQFAYLNQSSQFTKVAVDSGQWDNHTAKFVEWTGPQALQSGKLEMVFWLDNDTSLNASATARLVKWADGPMPTDEPLDLRTTIDQNNINILAGSALQNLKVRLEVVAADKKVVGKTIDLSKNQTLITLPSNNLDGQMVKVRVWTLQNNRYYSSESQLTIPDTTKELTVKTETFREKLAPGSVETVKIKVSSPVAKPLPAELLANMYDASLDALVPNYWSMNLFHPKYFNLENLNFWGQGQRFSDYRNGYPTNDGYYQLYYPYLIDEGLWDNDSRPGMRSIRNFGAPPAVSDKLEIVEDDAESALFYKMEGQPIQEALQGKVAGVATMNDGYVALEKTAVQTPQPVQMRRNLNETAFFYPHLTTDSLGNVSFTYTVPESLTKWKLMALAHNTSGQWGQLTRFAQTVKELMVVPEVPRFFREDDELVLATKIVNLTDNDLSAHTTLELLDAATLSPIAMLLEPADKTAIVTAQNNASVTWRTKVPRGTEAVVLRIKAVGNQHSDGEEHYIPVLPNRVMVSESLPITLNKKGKTVHRLSALEQSKNVEHHQLTLRYTQSAAWEVVKALPYLMEYPHECSEQLFSRLFGYTVGQHIVETYPNIKQALELWNNQLNSNDKSLISPLEQNEELKALILQETPWQQAGENETANRKRLLMLLDENYTNEQIRLAVAKLQELQLNSGEFAWFRGMGPDDYITRHLMIGFGQLKKMCAPIMADNRVAQMTGKGIQYLQSNIDKRWLEISKDTVNYAVNADDLHLLFAMSFYTDKNLSDATKASVDSMLVRMEKQKPWNSVTEQAIAAMVFNRFGKTSPTTALLASIREKAIGRGTDMVWFRSGNSWHWTDNAVETQSWVLQCLNELSSNDPIIAAMQNQLVAQKRTQSWPTTRSTTMAVLGMMSSPKLFENNSKPDLIKVGNQTVGKTGADKTEMLSGNISKTWHKTEIKPSMGKVTIDKQSEGPSWASLHWQYFAPIGEVKAASGPTSIAKTLHIQKQTEKGTQLIPLAEATPKVGDKVVVKLTITSAQAMDYVHIKDMRSALLEPVEVFSQYVYQNGLGYYRAGTDAAMNFFIGRLPKGTFTIEYELRITGIGNTTNGFAAMQCMYAPEFESRSESGVLISR